MTQTDIITSTTVRYLAELDHDPNLRSSHTRTQYASALRRFEGWRDGRPLSATLLESYLASMQQDGASPATVKQALAAVRWLARRAVKVTYDEQPPQEAEAFEREAERLIKVRVRKASNPLPAGRHLKKTEIAALLSACRDGSLDGLRDEAMIAVASSTAIRNAELRDLTLGDLQYMEDSGAELTIRHGKGDKPRVVDMYGEPLAALTRWIEKRGVGGSEYLFVRIRKGEQIDPRAPLSYAGTRKVLGKLATLAGVKHLTWHDFRRTVIGNLFDQNADISTIMDISGHAMPETAKRYDRRGAQRRKEALRKIQGS